MRFNKEFLAWILLLVSVYTLTIFILVRVIGLDAPQPVPVVVVTVVVVTPTPVHSVDPGPPPTPAQPCVKPTKPPVNKPQTGGYTGTVVVPYSQPVAAPVHRNHPIVHRAKAVTRTVYHRSVLHKRKHCVHHHKRHHHREHRKCHHHRKHH